MEMLAVGKELLIGRTMNTNAHWVGKRLAMLGSMINEITTVDDDLVEIASALRKILSRTPDFVVVVGGLGPTPDDMTLKGVADALGLRLKQDRGALALMREHYAGRGLREIELTPSRLKMTLLPEGSEAVTNRVGTAPGVRLVRGESIIYCLPGVPAEMKDIFRRSVEPELRVVLGELHRYNVTLKLEGILESALAPVIAQGLRKHPGAYIKSHPRGVKGGLSRIELDVAVVAKERGAAEGEGDEIVEEMRRAAASLGGSVVSIRRVKG